MEVAIELANWCHALRHGVVVDGVSCALKSVASLVELKDSTGILGQVSVSDEWWDPDWSVWKRGCAAVGRGPASLGIQVVARVEGGALLRMDAVEEDGLTLVRDLVAGSITLLGPQEGLQKLLTAESLRLPEELVTEWTQFVAKAELYGRFDSTGGFLGSNEANLNWLFKAKLWRGEDERWSELVRRAVGRLRELWLSMRILEELVGVPLKDLGTNGYVEFEGSQGDVWQLMGNLVGDTVRWLIRRQHGGCWVYLASSGAWVHEGLLQAADSCSLTLDVSELNTVFAAAMAEDRRSEVLC